jgi:hypothetical protein
MLIEIRQYQIQPGKRDDWVRFFEDTLAPYQTSKGMDILGAFIDTEDENGFVWIRRFENEEHRVELMASMVDSGEWREKILPQIPTMHAGSVVTRVTAIPTSAIQ